MITYTGEVGDFEIELVDRGLKIYIEDPEVDSEVPQRESNRYSRWLVRVKLDDRVLAVEVGECPASCLRKVSHATSPITYEELRDTLLDLSHTRPSRSLDRLVHR